MKNSEMFLFKGARRVTAKEVEAARKAIEKVTGKPRAKRLGRPRKGLLEKYTPLSIRLHPIAMEWLKKEAKKRKIPYQTLINQILLKQAA